MRLPSGHDPQNDAKTSGALIICALQYAGYIPEANSTMVGEQPAAEGEVLISAIRISEF